MKTLERICETLYGIAGRFADWFALLLTGLLFACGFFVESYAADMDSQKMLFRVDRLYLTLPLLVLGLFAGSLLIRWVQGDAKRRWKLLRGIVMVWLLGAGAFLIVFGRSYPAADPGTVYYIAKQFAESYYGAIAQEGSYLSYYPHQVGLCVLLSWLIRIWNLLPGGGDPYHMVKLVNVLLLLVILYFLSETVHRLWDSVKADVILLLLVGCDLSFILYSSFVYGEIFSLAAFSGCLYFLTVFFTERIRWKRFAEGAAVAACLALSVMARKNSLILMIAMAIVLVFEGIRRRRPGVFALLLAVLVAGLGILPLTQTLLEQKAGQTLQSGVTPLSYLAMGMQDSSRGPGWYNGFNFYTYQDVNLDADAANEISRKAISDRLEYFRSEPDVAVGFYRDKILSQWADGTYASRQATLAVGGERSSLVESVYTGSLGGVFCGWCNLWQDFLYLGAFLYCIARIRQPDKRLYAALCLICVMGGFLFHLIWEANSRYIFPYGVLLLPYAAAGLAEGKNLVSALWDTVRRRLKKE